MSVRLWDIQPLEGVKLSPYQQDSVVYAARRNWRILLADEMGTGKTFQSLAIAKQADAMPCVVVCPASLKLNWQAEILRALPRATVQVIKKGRDKIKGRPDFIIVNYDLLKARLLNPRKRLFEPGPLVSRIVEAHPKGLLVDESHYCKEGTSQRTRAVECLAQYVSCKVLLTGTPVVNRPAELISQLRILGLLDREFGGKWSFAKRYCDAHKGRWGWDLSGATNLGELHRKLSELCMLRRTKAQVLPELGAKEHFHVTLPLSNAGEYNKAEREFIAYLREKKGSEAARKARRAESLAKLTTLRRLSGVGKAKAAIEWCRRFLDAGEHLLVFAAHVEAQQALVAAFNGSSVSILGTDSLKQRNAAVQAFQASTKPMIAVCSLKAASEGLTLTRARHVAFLELGWTPKDLNQASDRAHRRGQTRPVTVWKLIATGTIDEVIERVIEKKIGVISRCVDGGVRASTASRSAQEEVLQHYEAIV